MWVLELTIRDEKLRFQRPSFSLDQPELAIGGERQSAGNGTCGERQSSTAHHRQGGLIVLGAGS